MKGNTRALLLLCLMLTSCGKQQHEVLIEAESFKEKGGWVVDPQFVEQMGSPYLLAHGLGIPVKNAWTEINLESPGKYYVWVRTKNWVAGNWEAPGRFRLLVNGSELEETLGTGIEKWSWQYAGMTSLKDTSIVIELKDLTGFEGRCDAVYLSTVKKVPPDEADELVCLAQGNSWRN